MSEPKTTSEPDTASETLFAVEAELRKAAIDLSFKSSNETRQSLRAAALKYADIANQIDEQTEFQP